MPSKIWVILAAHEAFDAEVAGVAVAAEHHCTASVVTFMAASVATVWPRMRCAVAVPRHAAAGGVEVGGAGRIHGGGHVGWESGP